MIEETNSMLSQNDIQNDIEEILNRNKFDSVKGWKESMNYLYLFSTSTGYIQPERLNLNIILPLFYNHQYDDIGFQVTINCSKPEIIVGQAIIGASHYSCFEGECVICFENVGSDKRKGLRAYQFKLRNGETELYRQFPPYPYFKHHNIIIDRKHTPQILSRNTIIEMLEMCEMMPGYKIASNTDRVGTGATNLSHRHFQAGDYQFTVFNAKVIKEFKCIGSNGSNGSNGNGTDDTMVLVQWLNYPCCCLKVIGLSKIAVENIVFKLFDSWRNGTFESFDNTLQTCSMISTLNTDSGKYEFLIFPRNAQQPRFLTRSSLQCIKKEFVGIFELCGFAILPGRLKDQLIKLESIIKECNNQNNELLQQLLSDNGFTDFSNWLTDYYFENLNHSISISDNLSFAIQKSFLTILSDNSPISLNQFDLLSSWINQSTIIQ